MNSGNFPLFQHYPLTLSGMWGQRGHLIMQLTNYEGCYRTMPGRTSRDKGMRGEREFAELCGGRRVPLSGAQRGFENDVLIPTPAGELRAEVKRRKDGFATLYGWLEDEREKPDLVAFRADRKPWLVCMSLETFLKLIGKDA